MIHFQLLGPLRLEHRGELYETPTAPKVRQLLALLLLKPNQVVSAELIVDELWGGNPPRCAVVTLQTYICHIRKLLARGCADGERIDRVLATVAPGYVLSVEPDQLDLMRFRDLHDAGCAHFESGEYRDAAGKLRAALELFRGPVLADVALGQVLRPYKVLLEEEFASARALRIQADLALGRHREIIGELKSLTVSRAAGRMGARPADGGAEQVGPAQRGVGHLPAPAQGAGPGTGHRAVSGAADLQRQILTAGQPRTERASSR